MKATTIRLPEELEAKLREQAQEQYISKNTLILQILKDYFERKSA